MKRSASSLDLARYTAYLALSVEVLDGFGRVFDLTFLKSHSEVIEKIGLLLFLVSLVGWLEGSRKSLAKLEKMSREVRALRATAKRMDLIARYGANTTSIARLLYPQDGMAKKYPHCIAGGETLSRLLLEIYKETAQEFDLLRNNDRSELKLKEHSVINLFLFKLVKSLPKGSVWLGISRMQDARAWREDSAEASYYDFERTVEQNVKDSSLNYFRLLCFRDEARRDEMQPVALHQKSSGIHVRSYFKDDLPPDLSLIWTPKDPDLKKLPSGKKVKAADAIDPDPIAYLEANYEPLCGLRFAIRGDREVDFMELFGSASDAFTELKAQFSRSWSQGAPY